MLGGKILIMNIPVIFIHNGSQDYFRMALEQARKHCSEVFSISTDNSYSTLITDRVVSQDALEFRSLYQHLSTNSYEIELMCFQRWFVLRDFMVNKGIDLCLYIDSDVLLYVDPGKAYEPFAQFDYTLAHGTSGHTSYWTLEGLKKLCSFLLDTYRNKASYDYEKIASHYQVRQKHGLTGGVCDMTLLQYHAAKFGGRVGEMMHILNGTTFDHNINVEDQDFEMRNGKKAILFENGLPYGTQKNYGKIRFNTLHCQGPAKSIIPTLIAQG